MKKLIVVIAAMAMAGFASASSYIWGPVGGSYTDKSENTMDYGTAFLYLGNVSASETAFNIGTATLITSSGYDTENGIYGYFNDGEPLTSDLITSTDEGQAFSIILVDKSVTSLDSFTGNYVIMTGESERGEIPGATTTYYATFANYDEVESSSWSTMSVPEPTSGLLLLLGMAGLALKRKIA